MVDASDRNGQQSAAGRTPYLPPTHASNPEGSRFSVVTTSIKHRSTRHSRPVPTVIVDKSVLFRVGLMHTLAETRFRVIASCSCLTALPPNAVNGSQCVALIGVDKEARAAPKMLALREKYRWLRVVLLGEKLNAEEFLAVIESGGDCYLLKNEVTPDFLLKALELVLPGGMVVSQGLAHLLRGRTPLQVKALSIASSGDARSQFPIKRLPTNGRLSNREHAIVLHLMKGVSNKHIARELDIAEATVKVHVKNLLRKIGARNRTQAAMWAINCFGPAVRDL